MTDWEMFSKKLLLKTESELEIQKLKADLLKL